MTVIHLYQLVSFDLMLSYSVPPDVSRQCHRYQSLPKLHHIGWHQSLSSKLQLIRDMTYTDESISKAALPLSAASSQPNIFARACDCLVLLDHRQIAVGVGKVSLRVCWKLFADISWETFVKRCLQRIGLCPLVSW